jgi:hypothetical protein
MNFWMVFAENGNAPVVKHATYESAKKEAERLLHLAPFRKVYVLQAVNRCELLSAPVVWTSPPWDVPVPPGIPGAVPKDDIPF